MSAKEEFMTAPSEAKHNDPCEDALENKCDCHCKGAGHGIGILKHAIRVDGPTDPEFTKFDDQVTLVFGSPFRSLTADPVPPEELARTDADEWRSISGNNYDSGLEASQVEKRIVDTLARDLLTAVAEMPSTVKGQWEDAVRVLGLKRWSDVEVAIPAGTYDEPRSGFLWASVLAATSRVLLQSGGVSFYLHDRSPVRMAAEIENALADDRFYRIGYPRNSFASHKLVLELDQPPVAAAASKAVAEGLWDLREALGGGPDVNGTASVGSLADARLLVQLMGMVTCKDLWLHPRVVHFCVVPAVHRMRRESLPRGGFSLDDPIGTKGRKIVETHIREHLADGRGKAWKWALKSRCW